MDFATAARLSCRVMQYRIELSQSRSGQARISFPGRVIGLEANQHVGPVWLVGVSDLGGVPEAGSVTVRADNAGDAVWRVARAAVRAMAELTDTSLDGDIKAASADYPSNLP